MQTKLLKYIFTALSAIYFILAGTGYNIIQYCCDDCEHEGIEFVTQNSCETVHHEKHYDCGDLPNETPLENNSLQLLQACVHDNSCEVLRVQLDDFSVVDESINTNTSSNDLFVAPNTVNVFSGHLMYSHVLHEYSPPPNLFTLTGREILSNKSVLII